MRILVIDYDNNKFNKIKKIIEKIEDNLSIDLAKSMSSGIKLLNDHNKKNNENNPYDLLICDSLLPMFDELNELDHLGEMIVAYTRKKCNEELIITMCSYDKSLNCDYDFNIDCDSSINIDDQFKYIINDINMKKSKRKILRKGL